MKKCTKKFWIKLEDFFLQFSLSWHSQIPTTTKCQQSFICSVMLKTIINENEFIIPRCDHKINFVLSYILFYSKEICWKKKRICWNTILMKFYVLPKCSEKNTEERESLCNYPKSAWEKWNLFFTTAKFRNNRDAPL
jgi:hypothetical protein